LRSCEHASHADNALRAHVSAHCDDFCGLAENIDEIRVSDVCRIALLNQQRHAQAARAHARNDAAMKR
jgi:hypothetical protein